MSTTVRSDKAKALAGVHALIAGTQKHLPSGQFTIGNATYAAASLIQLFQSLADAMTKQNEAKTIAKDTLTALRDVKSRVRPVMQGYRELLVAMFGSASQTLADFGLVPRKVPATQSVEKKAAAHAKALATRAARGTKGPKAKLAIKGAAPAEKPAPPAPTPPVKPAS